MSRNFVRHVQNRKRCFINDFEALTYANYLRDGTLAPSWPASPPTARSPVEIALQIHP